MLSKLKFSIIVSLLSIGLVGYANAAKLHLIAAADSADEGIGVDVTVDLVNVVALADRIAKDTDLELNALVVTTGNVSNSAMKNGGGKHGAYKQFAGKFAKFKDIKISHTKKMDKATVQSILKSVKAGNDDVIWFHYAGHGFRWDDQGAKWPALDLGGWVKAVNNDDSAAAVKAAATKSIQMQEIMDTLGAKGARLTIAISDSCNENNDIAMPKGAKAKGRGKSKLAAGFSKLFRKAKGHINISSTKPGQLAWGNREVGGVFTYLFIDSVIKQANKGDKADWSKVLKKFKGTINMDLGDGETSEDQHPRVEDQIAYGNVGSGGGGASNGSAKPARVIHKGPRVRRPIRPIRVRPVNSSCQKKALQSCNNQKKRRRFKNKKSASRFFKACMKGASTKCAKGTKKPKVVVKPRVNKRPKVVIKPKKGAKKGTKRVSIQKLARCKKTSKAQCSKALSRSKIKKKKGKKVFMKSCTKARMKRCLGTKGKKSRKK